MKNAFAALQDLLPFRIMCDKICELQKRCIRSDHGDYEIVERLTVELPPYVQALLDLGYSKNTIERAWLYFEDKIR